MPSGIEVFGADGVLKIDQNTRISKVIGSVNISGAGNITFTVPDGNSPWFFYFPSGGTGYAFPVFTINGTTISWTAGDPGVLVYGAY